VTAYLKKVNEPNFNYDQFYEEQMKSESGTGMKLRSSLATEYEKFLTVKSQKKIEDAKLYRSLLEKGDIWSEDLSDEELKAKTAYFKNILASGKTLD
jgi:preprotein translocase subunit SecA